MASLRRSNAPIPGARRDRAALPVERAFVVQFRADADLARGIVRGRVEHLTSGSAAVFESLEDLVAQIESALRRPAPAGE